MVLGVGNRESNLFLLGEAPGREEMLKNEPFVGKSGQLLDYIATHAKLDRLMEAFSDNVCKELPENYGYGSNAPTIQEIKRDRFYLKETLEAIKPQYIICLGATAIQWFDPKKIFVSDSVGKTFSSDFLNFPHVIIPSWHPSGILRSDDWKNYGELFGNLAYAGFVTKEKPEEFQAEFITRIPAEEEIPEILTKIENALMVSIDVEAASNGQIIGIGIAISAYEAYYFPWRLLPMFGYEMIPYYQNTERLIKFFQWLLPNDQPKIAQNIKYDMNKLEEEFNVKFNRPEYDSMEMARLVYNNFTRRGLDYLIRYCRPTQAGWKVEVKAGTKKNQIKWEDIPLETISTYCCYDALNTFFLVELFRYLL